ncbi:hypothetical protein AOCH_002205 [Aspergillus ochraceoroseus]|uniref:Amine oxidase domain-containing protein n=1 Tax=Aspergillus ochraceoroseus TaxID=138278 RepID=A0A0F8WZ97_9EURO|nr:hypothetical protein AOCH_002205 [Aspergillus ochraceoroseus]
MSPSEPKRVAIVGGGLTGIASFWALRNSSHDVHLFEASSVLGGHMKTLPFESNGNQVEVDLELPSFNPKACPNLVSLLNYLGIATTAVPFSFGASDGTQSFKWYSSILKSVLLCPQMLWNKQACRLLLDAICFRHLAVTVLTDESRGSEPPKVEDLTETYLSDEGYSNSFRDKYLAPLLSMLWRTNAGRFLARFPVKALARCLSDHDLLCTDGMKPKWWRIDLGVGHFIKTMVKDLPHEKIYLQTRVNEITRHSKSNYGLVTCDGQESLFDHVILTVDGNEIIRILGSTATTGEKEIIQCLGVTRNIVILHSDHSMEPGGILDCNYIIASQEQPRRDFFSPKSCARYNLNTLQNIPTSLFGQVLITFNPLAPPHPSLVQGVWEFTEPEPTAESLYAQALLPSIQNKRGLSYSFWWTGRGILEDAITSGFRIAIEDLGAEVPFAVDFHPQPLDSTEFFARQVGLQENLTRTVLQAFRVLVIVLEITLLLLTRLYTPGLKIRARRTVFRALKSSAIS